MRAAAHEIVSFHDSSLLSLAIPLLISFLSRYREKFRNLDWSVCGKVNHTGGVLAAADLNELLDVLDFLRHDGRCGIRRIWIVD